jgi:hypothetical protein
MKCRLSLKGSMPTIALGPEAKPARPSSMAASVREHQYEETVASAMRAAKLASAEAATTTRRTSKNMQKYTDEKLRAHNASGAKNSENIESTC